MAAFVDDFRTQAEELCRVHDHVTRVIANLDIPDERFADYDSREKASFELVPFVPEVG